MIYTSTDAGFTWTLTSAPSASWGQIVSSADGTTLVALAGYSGMPFPAFGPAGLYISTNSGIVWAISGPSDPNWTSVASSADGNKLAATYSNPGFELGIYTRQTPPTPRLTIMPAATNTVLSWIIPSLNFSVQQNFDLTTTNWTDVATTPVMNLTTLQNQVIVPRPSSGSVFYRLKH